MNFEKVKFCNSHTQREKTVHMVVGGEGTKKGVQEAEGKKEKTNWRGGRRETHSIILSKRKK